MSVAPWGYRRVKKTPLTDGEPAANELRVTAGHTSSRAYVQQAVELLSSTDHHTVYLRGMGQAIAKTVNIAELMKRCVPGLHQISQLGSLSITDELQPLVPGKEVRTVRRNVSTLTVTLSTKPLDESHSGYQPPLDPSMVDAESILRDVGAESQEGQGSTRRSRGPRSPQRERGQQHWGWSHDGQAYGGYDEWHPPRSRGRGGGADRGRRGRGWK
eukprot:TRINITY_DN31313_c0_g1_i1.p1 TRINITY_DN31313_c0_g1~~TRINITY_DN31313_c0_g1_i1.p1  ORF type:complete len:215 (+),score=69.58 TRINITY_DN31313_c0_g1_i1:102-746(+)